MNLRLRYNVPSDLLKFDSMVEEANTLLECNEKMRRNYIQAWKSAFIENTRILHE